MKYILTTICLFIFGHLSIGQNVPTPAKEQVRPIVLQNATIHLGTGDVLTNASIAFKDGKITDVGQSITIPNNAEVIDYSGRHIYPGFIAINTRLGLSEVESLRPTKDFDETGSLNPNVRAIIAYNTDSRVTPTVRSNGILMAQITPTGGRISGTSSIVQLDAWNWEDAAYKTDDAIYLNWPSSITRMGWWAEPGGIEKSKVYDKQLLEIRTYFEQAKAYADAKVTSKNLRFEGMKDLFTGDKKLFINVNRAKDIITAVRFAQDFGIKPVIMGGSDSHLITTFLKENNIPVVLNAVHRTPSYEDEGVNDPYHLPTILHDEGIKFALTYADFWQVRNLPFQAGTAVAHGLPREEGVKAITLGAAEILGIAERTGSLEKGKDATIIVSEGDALDMMSSKIVDAYIVGRKIDLGNKQKDLYRKFSEKYGHKVILP